MTSHRRDFLRTMAGGIAAFSLAPLGRLAGAVTRTTSDRIVVDFIIRGGADLYSWVIGDHLPNYHASKGTVAYSSAESIPLGINTPDPNWRLHPDLAIFQELWDDGDLAIFHKVGYPSPNLSHFVSQDIWAAFRRERALHDVGWNARLAAAEGWTEPTRAMLVDTKKILEVVGAPGWNALVFTDVDDFVLPEDANTPEDSSVLRNPALEAMEVEVTNQLPNPPAGSADELVKLFAEASATAPGLIDTIQGAIDGTTPGTTPYVDPGSYPAGAMGGDLRDVAKLLHADRVLQSISPLNLCLISTFLRAGQTWDTHTDQKAKLAVNIPVVSASLAAFRDDMMAQGLWEKVVITINTEFGRRNTPNQNTTDGQPTPGTDHGEGNLMFAVGGGVIGGHYGTTTDADFAQPNMTYTIDFRDVFHEALSKHLGVPLMSVDQVCDEPGAMSSFPYDATSSQGYLP